MLEVEPSTVGVVPSMVGVVPSMVEVVPGMVTELRQQLGLHNLGRVWVDFFR